MFDIKRLQTIKQEYWQRVEVPANCLPPSNRLCGLSQGRQLILSRLRLLFCMFHKVLRVSNGPLLLRLQSVESATRTGPASATTTPTLTWQRRRVRRRRRRRWARPLHVARTTTNVRCRLAFNYVEQQKASLSASSGMSWCLSWHTHKHYISQKSQFMRTRMASSCQKINGSPCPLRLIFFLSVPADSSEGPRWHHHPQRLLWLLPGGPGLQQEDGPGGGAGVLLWLWTLRWVPSLHNVEGFH